MLDSSYDLIKPMLFNWDAETAHERVLGLLERFPRIALGMAGRTPTPPTLARTVAGLALKGPVGLAAGLDKEARALPLWERLGFGFVEIGTITPRPQVGNARPRVHRFPDQGAVVNAMGFPSQGMEDVAQRLEGWRTRGLWPSVPVGVNLGKNKDTPADDAHLDYALLVERLRPYASYFVVNVSSPNTPGLRDLQMTGPLLRILDAVLPLAQDIPVFVKLAPDLEDQDLAAAVDASIHAGAAGIVATNTTRTRTGIDAGDLAGGMSGAPLLELALSKVQVALQAAGGRAPVIGVGGIASPQDAARYLDAGCSAVQLYTGLIFQGPGLVHRINASL